MKNKLCNFSDSAHKLNFLPFAFKTGILKYKDSIIHSIIKNFYFYLLKKISNSKWKTVTSWEIVKERKAFYILLLLMPFILAFWTKGLCIGILYGIYWHFISFPMAPDSPLNDQLISIKSESTPLLSLTGRDKIFLHFALRKDLSFQDHS